MFARNCLRGLLLLFASCSLFLMMSCQSGSDDTVVPEGQCTVTFSVTNYRQISFDDLSSSISRADIPTNHPATLAHLIVAVFDAETGEQACSPVTHDYKDYEENPYAYPQFSVTLPYGHYRVLVLGYNGNQVCNIASVNHISWTNDYVPNTFLYYDDFTLNKDSELSKDITLKHVVAAFRVTGEENIPAELKRMRFSSSAGGTVLDATTGYALENKGRTSEVVITNDNVGKTAMFTVYLFLPEEQITTNYTVQALGADDALLNEKHFNNVPLRINYLTEWKGKLFEPSDDVEQDGVQRGFSIEWDTKWEGTIPYNP